MIGSFAEQQQKETVLQETKDEPIFPFDTSHMQPMQEKHFLSLIPQDSDEIPDLLITGIDIDLECSYYIKKLDPRNPDIARLGNRDPRRSFVLSGLAAWK